ncbi:hypothetical protein HPO_14981 [Hyphomonas polymorpha PS728]|uniref:Uncharacterized protein n=1 Tax=Hyphomonas polymorpha PS728 TaxID=1280954 RepID=A0A062VHF7_9PROT|nr:hypothetical protein HPO_14981 [Hyphomonas polymorpha PS728]
MGSGGLPPGPAKTGGRIRAGMFHGCIGGFAKAIAHLYPSGPRNTRGFFAMKRAVAAWYRKARPSGASP